MVEYSYAKLSPEWDLLVLKAKLKRTFKEPKSLSSSADVVFIEYETELSPAEKTILDSLMADVNIGLYPETMEGYTVFTMQSIYQAWNGIETDSGLEIEGIYRSRENPETFEIWIKGDLTQDQKERLRDAIGDLWEEKEKPP